MKQVSEYIDSLVAGKFEWTLGYTNYKPYVYIFFKDLDMENVDRVDFYLSLGCGDNTNKREVDELLSNIYNGWEHKMTAIVKVEA